MKRFLDIDMDFFLNDIAYGMTGEDRLDDNDYEPWSEERFRYFLEEKCLLSKHNKIPGRVIKHHNQAFNFWEELITDKVISQPFDITHIDAHSDLGLGDSGWFYIVTELLHYPIEDRIKVLKREKVKLSNYLAFVIACGWAEKITFVTHPDWNFDDFFPIYLKDFDDYSNFFEFKAYGNACDLSDLAIHPNRFNPVRKDPLIPYSIFSSENFKAEKKYDGLVFCQSPQYTPSSADYMLEVIKEYIIEK